MSNEFYKTNNIELLKGDCIKILDNIEKDSVDMIFADPPYFFITAKPSGTFPWIYLVEYSAQPFASALSAMNFRYSSTVNALLQSNPISS